VRVPGDYYRSIHQVESDHWWHQGMRAITAAMLSERLERRHGQHLLDAGCGTGGFLRWALDLGAFEHVSGVDISPEAIELARRQVPEGDLGVAPVAELPFEPDSFDVVVMNDVLQHVLEREVQQSLGEVRRVLRPGGVLFLRTNGGIRARRVQDDWRLYDRGALAATLEGAGFRCERVTYVNLVGSLWGALRGRSPRAPSKSRHGIASPAGKFVNALGRGLLGAEARYLARPGRRLPYGHTLVALATPSNKHVAAAAT
jgi:SAM-dependent methyltransferase